MSFLGKLHEISLYGLIATIFSLVTKKVSVSLLWNTAFHPTSFITFFLCFLFWSSALYVPIAIIAAFATKYSDDGEGLTFISNNIVVIIFAHIAEELLGLILTPFWFLKDLFTKNFTVWKVIDYTTYAIELILIFCCILSL